jgi:hypothetical protein
MINTAGERRRPTAEGLLDCGDILMTVKKNARGAAKIWGWYLKYYGDQRDAAYVHIKLAEAFINKDPSLSDWGIVYAHLRSAKAVAPDDPNVDELLRKATPTALSEADVLHLLKNVEYPPEVLAELCRHTVMGFRLDQATVRRLLDAGVPPIVLTAIDESLKKNPPISQAAGGDDKHDGRLIGLWLMVVTDNAGRRIGANGLEFRGKADKWACVNFIERDGAPDQQAEFTWETVDNKQFVVRDTANRVFRYPYQFADGKLVVTYPDGSKAVYTRSQPRPAGGNG